MTRFCTECGARIEGNSRFCTSCGAPVPQMQEPPRNPDPQMGQGQQTYGQTYQQSYQQTNQQTYQQPFQQSAVSNPTPNPMKPKPNNYLALSIIITILCCWPLGSPAIVNAAKVDKYWREGDELSATDASRKAKTWSIVSAIGGLIAIIIVIIASMEDIDLF